MSRSKNKKTTYSLKAIFPKTPAQQQVYDYFDSKHLMLHGSAGTGKTFISLYLAFHDLFKNYRYTKSHIKIIRSAVPTRKIGFLPGSVEEKIEQFEMPYINICSRLFEAEDAYTRLKSEGKIQFSSTSFVRGMNFNNCTVIVDEAENLNGHELDSIITRLEKDTKIIFIGDFSQTDFENKSEKEGFHKFMNVIRDMNEFEFIEFTTEDIVRSEIVKNYIVTKNKLYPKGY